MAAQKEELHHLLNKYNITSRTEKAVAEVYRKRALKVHPDKGGSAEEFQALSADFKRLTALLVEADEAAWVDSTSKKSTFWAFFVTVIDRACQVLRHPLSDGGDSKEALEKDNERNVLTTLALEHIDNTESEYFKEWQEHTSPEKMPAKVD